jgi:hypothetical protein
MVVMRGPARLLPDALPKVCFDHAEQGRIAVSHRALCEKSRASIGSNGSASPSRLLEYVQEAFEERVAIMEFDGGLSRDEAEREAWALVSKLYREH